MYEYFKLDIFMSQRVRRFGWFFVLLINEAIKWNSYILFATKKYAFRLMTYIHLYIFSNKISYIFREGNCVTDNLASQAAGTQHKK